MRNYFENKLLFFTFHDTRIMIKVNQAYFLNLMVPRSKMIPQRIYKIPILWPKFTFQEKMKFEFELTHDYKLDNLLKIILIIYGSTMILSGDCIE